MVNPDGRLWRAGAAVAHHRAMPQRWSWLAGSGVQPVQDPGKPSARRDPAAAQHGDLETGSGPQMSILQEGAICAARPHDQVDRNARDHTYVLVHPDEER